MEFITHPLKPNEMPDACRTVEEIDMLFFTQFDVMYCLLSDDLIFDRDLFERATFILRAQWIHWKDDFFKHARKVESVNERKQRAWVDKHKDFIIQLADLEDSGADVVALFHEIIKQRSAESADNGRSNKAA